MTEREITKLVEDKVKELLQQTQRADRHIGFNPPTVREGSVGDQRYAFVKDSLRLYVKSPRGWEFTPLYYKDDREGDMYLSDNGQVLNWFHNNTWQSTSLLDQVRGDGTVGRVLRHSYLNITDGTNANTIKCELQSRWNGDYIATTDNISKGATTGNFTLNAGGNNLIIETTGITGDCLTAFGQVNYNGSGTAIISNLRGLSNDIYILFYNAATGANVDLTALVDVGSIEVCVKYITTG